MQNGWACPSGLGVKRNKNFSEEMPARKNAVKNCVQQKTLSQTVMRVLFVWGLGEKFGDG